MWCPLDVGAGLPFNKKKQESPGAPLLNAQPSDQKLYFIARVA